MRSYRYLIFKKNKTKRSQERMRQISLSRLQRDQVERKSYHEFKKSSFFKKMNSLELKNIE